MRRLFQVLGILYDSSTCHEICLPLRDMKKALILFMRYPEPGQVKTRLASVLGKQRAARVYEKLARTSLGVASDFAASRRDVELFVFFSPRERSTEMAERFPGPWHLLPQWGDHLGERMGNAIEQLMGMGFRHIVLAGTDLAHPAVEDYDAAFQRLEEGRIPLGPASDGGFYLIGLDRVCRAPFAPPTWGRGKILERTRRLLEAEGLQAVELHTKQDVDRAEDLACLQGHPFQEARLSVILPTTERPEAILERLRILEKQLWPEDELILVTPEDAGTSAPVKVGDRINCVRAPRGRGLQLNRGVLASANDLLLFLHDDSVPPSLFPYLIRKTLSDEGVALGAFSLRFSPSSPPLDLIAKWANFRSSFFRLPYGDQGLFCRREVFDAVLGFRNPFLFEDVDFVRSCRKLGRLSLLPNFMATSPRRYHRLGVLRTSLKNHWMMMLYHLGVKNEELYARYYGHKPARGIDSTNLH